MFMHGVQKSALNLGHVYARCAEVCLESGACLCTGGRSPPEIRGTFMHGGQKSVPDLGHINELLKWSALNLGQIAQ